MIPVFGQVVEAIRAVAAVAATTGLGLAIVPARGLATFERIVIATVTGAAVIGVTALALADVGRYSGEAVLVVAAVVGALAVRFGGRPTLGRSRPGAKTLGLCAAALAVLVLGSPPFDLVLGGRDHGTYVNTAALIGATGSIVRHATVLDGLPADVRVEVAPRDYLPGFYLDPRGSNRIVPQGYHLFPSLIAAAASASGDQGLWVVPAIAALGVVICGLLAARLAAGARHPGERDPVRVTRRSFGGLAPPAVAAVVTATLLGSNVAWIWYARMPMTESLGALLVFTGLLLWAAAEDSEDQALAVLAGAITGTALLVRPDALVMAPVLVVAGATLIATGASIRRIVAFGVPFAVCVGASLFDGIFWSDRYVRDALAIALGRRVDPLLLPSIGLVVSLLVLAAGVAARRPVTRLVERHVAGAPRIAASIVAVATVAFGLIALALDFTGVRWLTWYLSAAGLAAAGAGAVVATYHGVRRDRLVVLAPMLALLGFDLATYGRNPHIFSDQFWAIRRFLAFPIPAFAILAGVLAAFAITRVGRQRIVGVCATAVLLAVALVHQVRDLVPIVGFEEYRGAGAIVTALDRALPSDRLIVIGGSDIARIRFAVPLAIAKGRPVLGVRGRLDGRSAAAWLRDQVARRPVMLVAWNGEFPALDLMTVRAVREAAIDVDLPHFRILKGAIPRSAGRVAGDLTSWRLVPVASAPAGARTPAVDIATAAGDVANGFGPIVPGEPYRFVGSASRVLLAGMGSARTIVLTIGAPVGDVARRAVVTVNGVEAGVVGPLTRSLVPTAVRVPAGVSGRDLVVGIRSSPAAASDPRAPGVAVTRIEAMP